MFKSKLRKQVEALQQEVKTLRNSNEQTVPKKKYSSKGWEDPTDKDVLSELTPPEGLSKFRQMRLNDPIIGGLMLRIDNIFKNADWTIEGKNSDFVRKQLENLPHGLTTLIAEMTFALTYGFSLNEKVWKVENGNVILKDIPPIYQITIDDFDDRNAYQFWEGGAAEIPRAKCLHFIPIEHCRNPYGESLLRQIYKPYYYKTSIEAAEASGTDRDLTGLPVMTAPEGFDFSKADSDSPNYDPSVETTLTWAETIVSDVRTDAVEGIVKPFGWTLDIVRGETRTSIPTTEIITRYNSEIAIGLLQSFATIGGFTTAGGSEVAELIEDFQQTCNAFLGFMAKEINSQLVYDICVLNNRKPTPKFRFKSVQKKDLDKLASFVSRLVKSQIIDPTVTLEKAMLEKINIPYTADQEGEKKEKPADPDPNLNPGGNK